VTFLRSVVCRLSVFNNNSHFNEQIGITQRYKCSELINVFRKHSVDTVSAISLDRRIDNAVNYFAARSGRDDGGRTAV